MLAYLIPGITYGFAAAVTPGPLSAFLISQALNNGWRRTLPATFAPLVSDGPIALLVLLALSQVSASFIQYLRLLGGAFVLYLAFGALLAWRSFDAKKHIPVPSNPNNLLKAALVNWLNPNPYLGWSLVLGPSLLSGWRETPAHGIALVVGFYGAMIASLIAIIMLFAAARTIGPRVSRSLLGLSAIALACFGIYQLWLGSNASWQR
jgi:threonine/homoserine/homoserine lactone efflux protein